MDNASGILRLATRQRHRCRQAAWCLILSALVLCRGPLALGSEDPMLGINVMEEPPWRNISSTYLPLRLVITNHGNEHLLRVDAVSKLGWIDSSTTKTLTLPAGVTSLEIPLLRTPGYGSDVNYSFEVDGDYNSRLSFRGYSFRSHEELTGVIFIGRGRDNLVRAVEAERIKTASSGRYRQELEIITIPPERACQNWQFYAGLNGMIMLDNAALKHLTPSQREALSTWVRYGGGVLGLLGPGAEETMQGLRLPRQTSRETDSSIIKSQPCGLGKLFFWDEFSDLETIKENQLKLAIASHNSDINKILASLSGEDSYRYGQSRYNRRVAENIPKEISSLLEGLMKIPILGYSIIAILLAIIVGPLNLIILRRRKKIILFYLTAPALAIIGMLMLGSYTVVSEGLGAKLNEIAVLVHDPAFDDGAIYHAKGIYSAFAPSRLGYPAQTAAIPFWQGDQGIDILANDWNQGNTLTSGFVRSRSPSGLFTITPQHVRMGITVERGEDGKIYAHNGLTSTASWVIALVDKPSLGLTYYFTRNQIPPGEKAILQENNTVLNETFAAIPLLNKQLLRFQVCAELEALPYMEHGGLEDARVLSGKYYYVVLHSKADE